MAVHPIRETLPPRHLEALGGVIMAWAQLERNLRFLIYEILGVGPKEGRLAVREPRLSDVVALVRDLLEVKELTPPPELGALSDAIRTVEPWRNALAHGIWLSVSEIQEPVLQITAGNVLPKINGQRKEKIDPRGEPVTVAMLQTIEENIRTAHAYCAAVRLNLDLNRSMQTSPSLSTVRDI